MIHVPNFLYLQNLYCPKTINIFCKKEGCPHFIHPFIKIGVQLHRSYSNAFTWEEYLRHCKLLFFQFYSLYHIPLYWFYWKFLSNIMDNSNLFCYSLKVDDDNLKKYSKDYLNKIKVDTGCQCQSNMEEKIIHNNNIKTWCESLMDSGDYRLSEPICYEVIFPKIKKKEFKVDISSSLKNEVGSRSEIMVIKKSCKCKRDRGSAIKLDIITKTYSFDPDSRFDTYECKTKKSTSKKLQTNILKLECKSTQTEVRSDLSISKQKELQFYAVQNEQLQKQLNTIKSNVCRDFYYMLKLYEDENKKLKKEIDIVKSKLSQLNCAITKNCKVISSTCNQVIQTIPFEPFQDINTTSLCKLCNRNTVKYTDTSIDLTFDLSDNVSVNLSSSNSSYHSSSTSTAVHHYLKNISKQTSEIKMKHKNVSENDATNSTDLSYCAMCSRLILP